MTIREGSGMQRSTSSTLLHYTFPILLFIFYQVKLIRVMLQQNLTLKCSLKIFCPLWSLISVCQKPWGGKRNWSKWRKGTCMNSNDFRFILFRWSVVTFVSWILQQLKRSCGVATLYPDCPYNTHVRHWTNCLGSEDKMHPKLNYVFPV
jgi:hypothetical protein